MNWQRSKSSPACVGSVTELLRERCDVLIYPKRSNSCQNTTFSPASLSYAGFEKQSEEAICGISSNIGPMQTQPSKNSLQRSFNILLLWNGSRRSRFSWFPRDNTVGHFERNLQEQLGS